jgi:phosphoribosyl isomerase A
VSFTLLPAIDVAGGRAVRLAQGDAGSAVDHGEPLELAMAWRDAGASWIHLVDLDAAFGRGSNTVLLRDLVGATDLAVQLSGGIVDEGSLRRALDTGCRRVNLGTAALADRTWVEHAIGRHGEQISVSLDVVGPPSEPRLVARGAAVDVGELWETVAWLDRVGCTRFVVTAVLRDGMLTGPDLALLTAVAQRTRASVVASGGVGTLDDLRALARDTTVEGAIVGAALSAGRFTVAEALDAVAGSRR